MPYLECSFEGCKLLGLLAHMSPFSPEWMALLGLFLRVAKLTLINVWALRYLERPSWPQKGLSERGLGLQRYSGGKGGRGTVRLAERDGIGEYGEGRGTAQGQEFLGAYLGHSGPESSQTGPL